MIKWKKGTTQNGIVKFEGTVDIKGSPFLVAAILDHSPAPVTPYELLQVIPVLGPEWIQNLDDAKDKAVINFTVWYMGDKPHPWSY